MYTEINNVVVNTPRYRHGTGGVLYPLETGLRDAATSGSPDVVGPVLSGLILGSPAGLSVSVIFQSDEALASASVLDAATEIGDLTDLSRSGAGPYTYTGVISGLSAGTHTITVSGKDAALNQSNSLFDDVEVSEAAPIPAFGTMIRSQAADGLYNDGVSVTTNPGAPTLPTFVTTAKSPSGQVKLDVQWYDSGYRAYGIDALGDPVSSWINAKDNATTGTAITGDGVTDDGPAIQTLLNAFSNGVLYFPPGTYNIGAPVTWVGGGSNSNPLGARIIGHSPWDTTWKYTGVSTGVKFVTHDNWYGGFERITFDGDNKVDTLIQYPTVFRTNGQYRDCVFKNATKGLWMGQPPDGIAEHQFLRCWFIDLESGIYMNEQDTLDIFVWDSVFMNCGYALHGSSGNFSAFQNLFIGSTIYDLLCGAQYFTFMDNVSVGSAQFCYLYEGSSIALQRNRVFYPTSGVASETRSSLTTMSIDNEWWVGAGGKGIDHTFGPGEVISVGDYSDVATPNTAQGAYTPTTDIDPTFGAAAHPFDGLDPLCEVRLPKTPDWNTNIVEDFAGIPTVAQLQTAIDDAAAGDIGGDTYPVICLGKGKRVLDGGTLTLPANKSIQIVGTGTQHGNQTAFQHNHALTGTNDDRAAFRIVGPSKCGLHFLSVHSTLYQGTGVQIEYDGDPVAVGTGAALPARTILDHILLIGVRRTNVRVDGIAAHQLIGRDIGISGGDIGYWITGPGTLAGNSSFVNILSAGNSSLNEMIRAEQGGRAILAASWYEGSSPTASIIRRNEEAEVTYYTGRTNFGTVPGEMGWFNESDSARLSVLNQDYAPNTRPDFAIGMWGDGFANAGKEMDAPFVWATGAGETYVIGGRHGENRQTTPRYLNQGQGATGDVLRNYAGNTPEYPVGLKTSDFTEYANRLRAAVRQVRTRAPFEYMRDARLHDVMLDRVSVADGGVGVIVAPLAGSPYVFERPRTHEARVIVGGPYGYEDPGYTPLDYGRGYLGFGRPSFVVGEVIPLLSKVDERFEASASVQFWYRKEGGAKVVLGSPSRVDLWDDRSYSGSVELGWTPVNNFYRYGTVAYEQAFPTTGLTAGRYEVGITATGANATVWEDTKDIWLADSFAPITVSIDNISPDSTVDGTPLTIDWTVTPGAGAQILQIRVIHGLSIALPGNTAGTVVARQLNMTAGVTADLLLVAYNQYGIPFVDRVENVTLT